MVGIKDALQFIQDHPHPRLWRILGEFALDKLDFNVADRAFVRCQDYHAIQLVKRIRQLDVRARGMYFCLFVMRVGCILLLLCACVRVCTCPQDKAKQKAEVAMYFKRFDEAEELYNSIDRRDLALDMRIKLGDWFSVLQLCNVCALCFCLSISSVSLFAWHCSFVSLFHLYMISCCFLTPCPCVQSGLGDDALKRRSLLEIGDYFADRQKWYVAVLHHPSPNCTHSLTLPMKQG